ncbi:hypothetical protein [Nocardia brasiliensis]|nr:hypothetical protein [Nocardia brasiliensis]
MDIIKMLVRIARTFFPDQMRGVQLINERTPPELARTLEGQPEPTPQEA